MPSGENIRPKKTAELDASMNTSYATKECNDILSYNKQLDHRMRMEKNAAKGKATLHHLKVIYKADKTSKKAMLILM